MQKVKIYYKQSNPLIPEVWYVVLTPERYTSNGNDKSLTSNTIRQAKILWHFPRTQTHTHRRFNIRPQPQASLCHPPSCSHPPFLFFQSCVHICHHCSSVHTHTHAVCLPSPLVRHRCPALLFSLSSFPLPCLVVVVHLVTGRYTS